MDAAAFNQVNTAVGFYSQYKQNNELAIYENL